MTAFAEIVDDEVTLERMRQKRGRRKWKRYDPDVIPLYFCSPDYPVPPEVKEAALQAVKDECFEYSWFPETIEAMTETTRAPANQPFFTIKEILNYPVNLHSHGEHDWHQYSSSSTAQELTSSTRC